MDSGKTKSSDPTDHLRGGSFPHWDTGTSHWKVLPIGEGLGYPVDYNAVAFWILACGVIGKPGHAGNGKEVMASIESHCCSRSFCVLEHGC